MGFRFEQSYPWAGGLTIGGGVAGIIIMADGNALGMDSLKQLYSGVLNVSAIFIGFTATAMSILIAIENRPIVNNLKKLTPFEGGPSYYNQLIGYLTSTIRISFLLAIMSAFAIVTDLDSHKKWHVAGFAAWVVVLVVAGLSCYRVINLLAKVLRGRDR